MHDNPLFSTAADFVNSTSRNIFLTGKAGTGKTTFLKYIRENTTKKCVVVAPTGVAAMNAGGVTMHSFFQLPLGPFIPVNDRISGDGVTDQYTLFKNIRVSENKREIFRDLELLIIDEVSMVRADMLDATDAILRYFRKALHTPFGGVQVLFIGDLFQLPPVMPDSQWSLLREYYESPFFFHSKVIAEAPPVYIELKKIYRQSQQDFIDILNRIRNAAVTRQDLDTLNGLIGAEQKAGEKYITLTSHNHKADKINADELGKLEGNSHQFKGIVEGDFPEKTLPTEALLELKEGAQVMFIRNDKSETRRYYNGKLATVTRIKGNEIFVMLAETGEEIQLEQETWTNMRYSYNKQEERIDEEKLGSFTQYPIRLAWAITIHKSQGLTFQHAIIDAGDSFAPGQVYVALSRCTSLEGLILHSRIHSSTISTDPLVIEFAKREAAQDELMRVLEKEKRDFQNLQLANTFDLAKLVDALRNFVQYLSGRQFPGFQEAIALARTMLHEGEELQKVALKFQQQVMILLAAGDEAKLGERISKANEYFGKGLHDSILVPLDEHLATFKGRKKVKKYVKYVRDLRNTIARKITSFGNAQHGAVTFKAPATEEMVRQSMAAQRKPEISSTVQETLTLLKEGLKPDDIAERRGLALGTIEVHIAKLIKIGEIDISEFMSDTKVDNILTVIRELKTDLVQPVKQKLGDEFTYGEIRAVISHLDFSRNKHSV